MHEVKNEWELGVTLCVVYIDLVLPDSNFIR